MGCSDENAEFGIKTIIMMTLLMMKLIRTIATLKRATGIMARLKYMEKITKMMCIS